MKFTDWWNGPSGFSDFTRKEISASTGIPKRFKYYEEALERAFYAGKPKPSTDFTIPKSNPYKTYLMWDSIFGTWEKGFYTNESKLVVRVGDYLQTDPLSYTHWLHMPDAP